MRHADWEKKVSREQTEQHQSVLQGADFEGVIGGQMVMLCPFHVHWDRKKAA